MKHPILYILFLSCFLAACSRSPGQFSSVDRKAVIFPPYEETSIPYNIAPLNFQFRENGDQYYVRFIAGKDSFDLSTKKNVAIPLKKWKRLLNENKGKELVVQLFIYQDKKWSKYRDLNFRIAEEPIDPYIAYRLIEPGYELWHKMGIYQRCIENFNEYPILHNNQTEDNCMNCHSFCEQDPDRMLFHMRSKFAGTVIVQNGNVEKVSTKLSEMISEGVYPRWHPEGRYIAFSVNTTLQIFLAEHTNKIEVFDKESDIILYDTQNHTVHIDNNLYTKNRLETFPEWSPDGRYLYYCSAATDVLPANYQNIQYDLLRIPFNPATGRFGNQVDTIISSHETGKSVALPRISPDGRTLLFCLSDYGTFPIWHRENDLYAIDLTTREITPLEVLNSDQSDSYHTWSSNGRWLIFSSRRMDGLYTRPFISYVDRNGQFHPPFVLPQKNPEFYDLFLRSYNIPEFIKGKVEITPQQLSKEICKPQIPPQMN